MESSLIEISQTQQSLSGSIAERNGNHKKHKESKKKGRKNSISERLSENTAL